MEKKRRVSYKALASELRRLILDGTTPVGSRIPGEMELARTHGVSRTTARLAVKELERESLVFRRQGAGTFVSEAPSGPSFACSSFTRYLRGLGTDLKREVLKLEWVEPSVELATALRIPVDSAMMWFRRRDTISGTPMAFDDVWIVGPYAHRLGKSDLERVDFFERWQQKQNFRPTSGNLEMGAAPANAEQAELLGAPIGHPLLLEFNDMFLEERGVARFRTWYRYDMYRSKRTYQY